MPDRPAPLALTDLEARLTGPEGEALRTSLAGQLQQLREQLQQAAALGLPPASYARHQQAADACTAALEVLEHHAAPSSRETPWPSPR